MREEEHQHPIVLYDGVCGLCNRGVQFLLKRDHDAVFRFASLQSKLGGGILERHGINPTDLDTFYVVIGFNGALSEGTAQNVKLLSRSDAVSFVLRQIGGVWPVVGGLFRLLPRLVRDGIYRLLARWRYRIFGRYEACPLPSVADRGRFLDVQ